MNKGSNYIKLSVSFLIVIIFLFGAILAKLIYIAVSPTVDGIDLKALSDSITWETSIRRANRGKIFDINGEALARNITSYTVVAFLDEGRTTNPAKPRHVIDKHATAAALSEIINMEEEHILNLLNLKGYQVELGPGGRDITELTRAKIEALDLPGIGFLRGSKRTYPYGSTIAPYIIGYAKKLDDGEIRGEMGIESRFNEELKGQDGSLTYQRGANGFQIPGTAEYPIPSVDGYDIYLTLDYNIQMYLESTIREFEGISEWATITVADANTGAIVGSATLPSFDPNNLSPDMNYNNPLTSFAYEPGSTMKTFTWMAAMENNVYNGNELFASGNIMVGGTRIRDANRHGWGQISFDTAFAYSSNVGAVRLAQRIGIDKLLDYYEKLGFGAPTGIDLPNELAGRVAFSHNLEFANASFGQGLTTTPIQNIKALTPLTNNGTILKPFIISKIVDPTTDEVVYEGTRTEGAQVASQETVDKIIELMDLTVNGDLPHITAHTYHMKDLTLIGKTGTAQFVENGVYVTGNANTIRSFAGIFPKEEPQYIIYVSVKRLNGLLGARVVNIVRDIATYKNISDRPSDIDRTKIVKIENYVNRPRTETVRQLRSFGLDPIVIGNGEIIVKQSPRRDTSVIAGSKVFLLTNGNEFKMPNAIGWHSSEIISFANMLNLPYTINGYGRVRKLSIKRGEIINHQTLEITLDNRRAD